MPKLSPNPGDFVPTGRYTQERMEAIDKIHDEDFLWPEERKLMHHMVTIQNEVFAWNDDERGTPRLPVKSCTENVGYRQPLPLCIENLTLRAYLRFWDRRKGYWEMWGGTEDKWGGYFVKLFHCFFIVIA
ncbi:hypothetical protein B0H14DRAFT_3485300 [Mycena olivaceomarginata]|nr:hypothetical protein B0H14DRAFT_3485300 [Mycena olivaceomarginata]